MNYIELSKESAHKESLRLAEKIKADFIPDAVVFVAKGAYQIGLDIGEFFGIPVIEIFAERQSNKIKKLFSPLLKCFPSNLKKLLRSFEIKSDVHSAHAARNVYWGHIPAKAANGVFKNIILVDDACDTGNTFKQCVDMIKNTYPKANVKTAVINVFSASFLIFKTDYFLYKDCMISGPWSNDSLEHSEFIAGYNTVWKNNL